MKIKKEANGNVVITDDSDNVQRIFPAGTGFVVRDAQDPNTKLWITSTPSNTDDGNSFKLHLDDISEPSFTDMDDLMQQLSDNFFFKLAPVAKEEFFRSDYNSNNGSYRVRNIGGSGAHRFSFRIPENFQSLNSLKLIGIISSGAAGSGKDIDLISEYAAIGEDKSINGESDVATVYDFTGLDDEFAEIDISGVFTGISAGDKCGLEVDHNGIGGGIDYIGIELLYF